MGVVMDKQITGQIKWCLKNAINGSNFPIKVAIETATAEGCAIFEYPNPLITSATAHHSMK